MAVIGDYAVAVAKECDLEAFDRAWKATYEYRDSVERIYKRKGFKRKREDSWNELKVITLEYGPELCVLFVWQIIMEKED